MKLRYNVAAQVMYRVDTYRLASESRLYISGEVSFDSEWTDVTSRYLTFELVGSGCSNDVPTIIHAYLDRSESDRESAAGDDVWTFPESLDISLSAGVWLVSAHGTNSAGKRIDTAPIELYVARAGGTEGEAPPYVAPTAAEQIAAVAAEARDIAKGSDAKSDEAIAKSKEALSKSETAEEYAQKAFEYISEETAYNHNNLTHREDADQHPIEAITDLSERLDDVDNIPLTNMELNALWNKIMNDEPETGEDMEEN